MIIAAVFKAVDPVATEKVLRFNGLSEIMIPATVYLVVVTEIVPGWWMMTGRGRASIAVASILFIGFTVQLVVVIVSDSAPTCGCFGAMEKYLDARSSNWLGSGRNVIVLMMLALLWVLQPVRATAACREVAQ